MIRKFHSHKNNLKQSKRRLRKEKKLKRRWVRDKNEKSSTFEITIQHKIQFNSILKLFLRKKISKFSLKERMSEEEITVEK